MNISRVGANSDLDVIVDWRKPFVAGAETLEHVASEPRLSAMTTQWAMVFQRTPERLTRRARRPPNSCAVMPGPSTVTCSKP